MLKKILRQMTVALAERFGPKGMAKVIADEKIAVARNYNPLPVVLAKGRGAELWDMDGKKYIDMMSAYSAVSHGHAHPRILAVLKQQADDLAMCSRAYYTAGLGPFAAKLADLAGLDMVLPMNTGAEAVETAIKAARQWAYVVKKVPDNSAEIIVAGGNFHGRTTTIVSFSTEPDYRKNFGPFTPGFKTAPFGDLAAFEAAITPNTAAILVEPIQGEAGIVVPPEGFLRGLRALCDRHNVLLMVDEIQSGLGRTGKMFCFQHDGITPDVLILGKALGGGVLPVSAVVGTRAVMSLFQPGSHGSTFGGNPLAAAVGLEALNILIEENLVDNSRDLGAYMLEQLRGLNHPAIRDVRGRGLWIGVDIDPAVARARAVCENMMKRGILSKDTHETVIRFAPPLMVTKAQIDECLAAFRAALMDLS